MSNRWIRALMRGQTRPDEIDISTWSFYLCGRAYQRQRVIRTSPAENLQVLPFEGHRGQEELFELAADPFADVEDASDRVPSRCLDWQSGKPVVPLTGVRGDVGLLHAQKTDRPAGYHDAGVADAVPHDDRVERIPSGARVDGINPQSCG